ncbi:MAG: hypothetical protein JWP85_2006 [Rhodoglobus sp.]|nr:hypothetical protein [Rhodoglobus sp.]
MSDSLSELRRQVERISSSGTIWFAATLLGAAIPLAGLLDSGWRPGDLPATNAIAWWVGAALVVAAIGSIAWAGCPVWVYEIETEHRLKARAIRGGLLVFAAGSIISLVAVLAAPA